MRAVITQEPAVEPIVLADAKTYLRVDTTADDSLITALITASRRMAELYTQRAFITQKWDLWLDNWPYGKSSQWWDGQKDGAIGSLLNFSSSIDIPKPPLISIDAVNTYDETDTATLFAAANYFADTKNEPGRLALRTGCTWQPFVKSANGIQISFTAGYGSSASNVPLPIVQAIYQTISHLYENRGDQTQDLPLGAKVLLEPYRMKRIV
jgi:hypothetical protein